ncbi:MAG: hypothetical protein OQL27_04315 [Sedimenticola sp.]|nr:hypothetical protein [Sedimenticola sp.]
MKKLLITALISLFAVGTASADYTTDINNDALQVSADKSSMDFNKLPATAAGKSNEMNGKVYHAGMQDHPSQGRSGF